MSFFPPKNTLKTIFAGTPNKPIFLNTEIIKKPKYLAIVLFALLNAMDISNLTFEEVLQNNSSGSILNLEGIAELYEHMKLEKLLSQNCDLEKIKYRVEINQYYLVIKRKQFTANSREALLLKLYDYFFGAQNRNLTESYRECALEKRISNQQ